MSEQELPPWLREQVSRLQQLQQNLQAIMMQKQQLEVESVETDRALEELKKAGAVLIKAKKEEVVKELEERKELSNTRVMVLSKQETRVKENLKEVENKINEMIRSMQSGGASSGGSIGGPGPRPRGE